MKSKVTIKVGLAAVFIALLGISGYFFWTNYTPDAPSEITQITEKLLQRVEQSLGDGEEAGEEEEKGYNKPRYEYLFKLLRDPATNSYPEDLRARELSYARSLPTFRQVKSKMKGKAAQVEGFNWSSAGPTDVGGRTRALAVDRRDSSIVIAGGVSGGIWKSNDGGDTWQMKTPDLENLSVTSLAQHPINQDVWYYTSGEFIGNSARAPGAPYYGTGIFRSTDNGETWNRIPSTSDRNTAFDSPFDFMTRIRIHPATGNIYVASNGFGILRSTDGGDNFSIIDELGEPGYYAYADVAIADSTGDILAVLSSEDALSGDAANNPGVFLSQDNGTTWTEITPATFPENHGRSVVTFAPSNNDIAYILTDETNDGTEQEVSFHYFNLATGIANDRTANLPDFRDMNGNGSGYMNLQGGYNMVVAVKPDDPNYVFVGGTNLFRSANGFASPPPDGSYDASDAAEVDQYWIGGYSQENNFGTYGTNMTASDLHHPDQHIIAFDPTNPDRMWSGHDGGISLTENVTATEVHWEDKNEGYIVTQFYTSAIPAQAGDNRLMGGTQDNGTPFFRASPGGSPNASISSLDISFGDGGYCFFTQNHFFVSQQNGVVIRYAEAGNGDIAAPFSYVFPDAADDQLFIHPYTIDPNNEDIMYYPDGNELWRTDEATTIQTQNSDGATSGFTNLTAAAMPAGYTISALEVTRVPANILYYAGSSLGDVPPVIYKLENASGSSSPVDISIEDAPNGAWVKDIAVNPINGNEAIVVMSNYNIIGLYHTVNGGNSWTAIEGNLEDLSNNSAFLGPSLRAATIIPSDLGTIYVVGTSTGIYTTSVLESENTTWGQVATETVGYAVTDYLASRVSDGDIAAGTHGRGMFLGDFQGNTDAPFILVEPAEARAGEIITLRANDFQFSTTLSEITVQFEDVTAEVISVSPDSTTLRVRVPRGVIERQVEDNTVTVSVMTGGQTVLGYFTILPPLDFQVTQNFPNPFSSTTTIPFDLPVDSRVTLAIYDITGKRVLRPLWEFEFNAGTYNQQIDFTGLASGIYIYRIVAEPQGGNGQTFIKSKKLTYIK
ncbi:MAG TPA: T9SS type A sorting domain-containing protein [Balneolaceae bacterium]